ncbi:DICT sensory domain-containing protein [Halobacterium sp. CBA1126]|uniref:DICT sensory domain-containing protein n=1 Tax=Halobacterium TaxID=2239 RepID=UPI0012FACF19|nr:histidine kinase [Halobacterium sp. CBA1126]MUV60911.1 histidine kinase [Halobacterium sp. CBA1126]
MADDAAPRLQDIVDRVDERALTLTLYNADVPRSVLRDVQSYFEVQSVDLRRAATDDGDPRNFVVLHDGSEYLAATSLGSLYRVIRPDSPLIEASDPGEIAYPELFEHIDQSVFTDYGRDRMVVASREIESSAHRLGGRLHAGFQRLSNLRPQYRLYERLAAAGVDTHIYGRPNWTVPTDAHTIHAYDDEEITDTWFVVLDADDDADKRALLAEERHDDQFYGFWTFDSDIVDTILARLEAFPATGPA